MILKIGSSGKDVAEVQRRLGLTADGLFGADTSKVVIKFQQASGLNADGLVGPLTWKTLFGTEMPEPLITLPIRQSDCPKLFGDPMDSVFRYAWIVSSILDLGFKKLTISCHKVMVEPLQRAIANLKAAGVEKQFKTYDGCWVVRHMRGSSSLSMHAYGLAIDLNAAANPFHCEHFAMTEEFAGCFEKAGFTWGGRWRQPDAMHFQIPRVG
jgi:hypothetical protein